MNTTSNVLVSRQGHIATVTLARPEMRNAFDADTIASLTEAFTALATATDVRAVLLRAEGQVFCAGADLNWMRTAAAQNWDDNHQDATRLADMLWALASLPMPVVAQVQGDCYGGGVGLVACCDVVVASRDAGFSLSEAKLGLIPATISPYVIRAMGERAAARYFVTAERFSAERAQQLGLVHDVVDFEALNATTEQVLSSISANGPQATRACKQLVRDIGPMPLNHELRDLTARRIADVRAGDEAREGLSAFLRKTRPAWQTPQA